MYGEIVWALAVLITLAVIWIVSHIVHYDKKITGRISLFVWVYSIICMSCLILLWLSIYWAAIIGELYWSHEMEHMERMIK